ncbi:MAG: MMPL family transporter [Candidatus Omnitrophica bacterium]|nr:MMPL family transporter [Candidatus Omnitrophota bacterium]
MFRKFAEITYLFKWPIACAIILITIIMGQAIFKLEIDPSMETLFVKSSPEYLYYRAYSEKYGSDQMIAVAMATPDLFTLSNLRTLRNLTETIGRFDHVERVLSLSNSMSIRPKLIGIKIEPLFKDVLKGKRPVEELRKEVLGTELYVRNLVSTDGKVATILIHLKPTGKNLNLSGSVIKNLRQYLAKEESPGIRFYVAGSPVEQYDFIRLIRSDQFVFVPLIAVLLILTTVIIYGNFNCMVLAMAIVFTTLIWSIGTISLFGQQLNLMTSLLAPVIMIVAVINSIYLMNAFFEIRVHQPSLKKSVVLTIDRLGEPCFLTHMTAMLGFLSLAITPVPAIQSFGIFAALGTFYSFVVEMLLTPILLPILPYRNSKKIDEEHLAHRVLVSFLENLDFKWKWLILGLTFFVIAFSWKGIMKIEVDTNIVKQMKPDLPLAVSTRFIDQNLTGVYSLNFVLRPKDGSGFANYEALRHVEEFKDFLEANPAISKVNSITTVVKKINEARANDRDAYKIPKSESDIKRYLNGIVKSRDPEAVKLLSPDLKEIRLEARMRAVGTTEGAQLEIDAKRFLDENSKGYFDYHLTGNVVLLGKMAKDLLRQQLESFGFAFISILILIILIFRSFKLALLAAIPNLIPILAIYGLMGFCGIELSTPTAMISSIVLGLVVDASIQFLYRFRYEFKLHGQYLRALHTTYQSTGHSMVVSTLILVIGFASSVFASFRPTIHFGLLTSLTIFFALVCTVVVLPVCLLIIKPFGPQKLFRHGSKN